MGLGHRVGLLGGVFDPPHNGHVALARAALERFGLDRLLVLVVAEPGHKLLETPADARLALARAAFAGLPRTEVALEHEAYTVDSVRDGRYDDALLFIGADEFADFPTWKEPQEVLDHVRLAVAMRPGYRRERLDAVLDRLGRPDRVEFFDVEPLPIASRDVRAALARAEPVDGLVPPAVADAIRARGLYRREAGLH